MQCEYQDNASGRITAAESIADAWARDGLDVSFREVDPDWQPLTPWQPFRPGTAALYAPPTPADPETDAYVPPDPMLEIDRDTMRRLGELADARREDESRAVAAAVNAYHAMVFPPEPHLAGAASTVAQHPSNPHQPKETHTMRIAVKSTGGITESFVNVGNVEEGVQEAAKQIAGDCGLPTDIELWSDHPTPAPPAGSANSASSPWTAPATSSNSTERAAPSGAAFGLLRNPATDASKRTARGHPRARSAGGVKARPLAGRRWRAGLDAPAASRGRCDRAIRFATKETSMQKAPATAASPETRLIPLNKLRVDERNVRSASADPARVRADAELAASIKAHGLLENLVVVPRGKTQFGVAAGARRLRALKALAAEKHLPSDFPVPCLLIDGDAAAESSLVENAVRIAMHPADQVVAFSRLSREGATPEQIAARFGVSERTVQKRVRLGSLPDEVIAAYREGRINADTAEAFATTGDTDFQRTVFESLSQAGQLYGHNVRQALSQRQARSDAPAALFVGLDAYRAAGGTVEDPLFEDDFLTILDPELMHELAQQKLNAEAAKYAKAWKWAAVQLEFTWMDQQKYLVAGANVRAEFSAKETDALNAAEALIEEASEALDDPAIDGDARRELWATVSREQKRYAEIERARADRDEYSDTVRAHAGVIVALDREGNLDIHRGLVRSEHADAYRAATASASDGNGAAGNGAVPGGPAGTVSGDAADAASAKKHGGWTDALRNDLRIMRTAAIRRAMARDPDVATDLIAFVLARAVGFGRSQPRFESPVLSIRQEYQGLYASDAMKASPAMNHLEPVPAVDLGWLAEEDAGAAFQAYRSLADDERASVLAHAVATLIVPRLADDQDASGAHEEAVRNLSIDFPAELAAIKARPFDADLVWNRMNKGLILDAAAAALGHEWAAKHNGLKKKDLVAAASEAFRHDPARNAAVDAAATRWLPPGFEPVDADCDTTPQPATEVSAADHAEPHADAGDDGSGDPEPATGNGTTDAPADAGATDPATADDPLATDADGNGGLPAFLTS